ncbi:uncharacterized protein LOC34622088 [Cyclospora cayetanensis]|uniref:Uncharacterized protein LOC34622088 n=2 Tax=Cyclospora cayetanensis TaxID=88456 RepID=A0A6P5WFZ7_9EIME|nr:uncharacterized protein LOC34622088 [Cyclospora cayetanensis]OEH79345.1 hypothetical protein cyc_05788 [Cyclospora cayetanensis]
MQSSADYPVVPMGRMPISNAFNGHPRRRMPHEGAKLKAKEDERKKPTLKEFWGVTPLDILGNVCTDNVPTPVRFLQKFIGRSSADATENQTLQSQREAVEMQAHQEAEQSNPQQTNASLHSRTNVFSQPQPQLVDARTNLERYMDMKMQEARAHMQFCPMGGPTSLYTSREAYPNRMYNRVPPFCSPPPPTDPSYQEGLEGCWDAQGTTQQLNSQDSLQTPPAYFYQQHYQQHLHQHQQGEEVTTDAHGNTPPAMDSRESSRQAHLPESLQFGSPPNWLQHKSYMPQVPQYSHMTAPVPGAPFHPGFSYATDFKYYYNYYPADQYAGEIDGGDATAQEEAVAREQEHAEQIVGRQESREQSTLQPIITSKRRLESGKAVPL